VGSTAVDNSVGTVAAVAEGEAISLGGKVGLTAADNWVGTMAAVAEGDAMGEGVVAPLHAHMESARPVKSRTGSDLLGMVLSSFRVPNMYSCRTSLYRY
jgi:hypothetical protein